MSARFRPTVEALDQRIVPATFGNPWPSGNLTLSFVPDGTDVNGAPSRLSELFAGVPTDVWQGEILRAFQTWAVAANVNIGLVADDGSPLGAPGSPQDDVRFGDVRVAAVPLAPSAAALALPFDATAGTRSGDVWFNSSLPFSVGGATGSDIFTVALHEAGHVLGLDETADPGSALFDEALTRYGLSIDDVATLVSLYGPRRPDAFDAKGANENLKTASSIQVGSGPGSSATANLTADLATPSDVDTYTFQAGNLRGLGLTATVRVSGYSLLVPKLEFLDASGRVLASGVGTRTGAGDVTVHLDALTSGATYFVRVSAGRSDIFGAGGYTLELRPDAASGGGGGSVQLLNPDSGSNDTLGTASQIGQQFLTGTAQRPGYLLSASLNSGTDVDFYRLKSPQTANNMPVTMTITVSTTPPGGTDPIVEVYDARGVRVAARVLAHDGGSYTVQLTGAASNSDYYVAVRHAHPGASALPGNYTLDIDFGSAPVVLADLANGTFSAAAPLTGGKLVVTDPQVLHLVFDLSAAAPSATAGARLTVLDALGTPLFSRFVLAGDAMSTNLFLRPGTYTVIAGAGTLDGSALGSIKFALRWLTLSDPIGPQPVSTTAQPAGAPAPISAPGPVTESAPLVYSPAPGTVQPTGSLWWLAPPTDWTSSDWAELTTWFVGW